MFFLFSHEQAGRYLEIYKAFERKPPDLIKERVDNDYMSLMTAALTSVRGVNKTDVHTLTSNFGVSRTHQLCLPRLNFDFFGKSFKRVVTASADELAMCPGLGEKKVKRLKDTFGQSFVTRDRQPKSQAAKNAADGSVELN
jgi:DNA excision repair protein ERCC-1